VAVAAFLGSRMCGLGWFETKSQRTAEVTFRVADGGEASHVVGIAILHALAQAGREAGIRQLTSHVLLEDQGMFDTLRRAGLTISAECDAGVTCVTLDIGVEPDGA
jgi:hypothetical protein